ncbi:glyoxalase [Halorubrum salipaludis]|uniref:Glyoxalase n=1 Tax=Halorubrum salipaludis TaxID=2032630 RepID=A0A2A2FKF4_9EURY|nr:MULTISPECIES: VOC family protein [Halorubrum]PAU85330.1 glyoxalase [Halorubrum salipaludis]
MSGIAFHATERHDAVVEFYRETMGATVRLEQPDCTILRYDNMLFGFCERGHTDDCGTLTFVYSDREAVDEMHAELRRSVAADAIEEPRENERYDIYQFFAEDPDGRTVECQAFLDEAVSLP